MTKLSIFLSDFHCGSTVGLMKPERWVLEDGTFIEPSPGQKIIWNIFDNTIDHFNEEFKFYNKSYGKRPKKILHLVGDLCDNMHYMTTELTTMRVSEQKRMGVEVVRYLLKALDIRPDHDTVLFYTGTPAHSDDLGDAEEFIARQFKEYTFPSVKGNCDEDGKWAHEHFRYSNYGNVIDVKHFGIAPSKRIWLTENILYYTLKDMNLRERLEGRKQTNWFIRAHRHRYMKAVYDGGGEQVTGTSLPCFQMKTHYVYHAFQNVSSHLGGYCLVCNPDGTTKGIAEYIEYDNEDKVTEL